MNSTTPSAVVRTEKGRKCKALFSYNPTHEDELTLLVGDEVLFLEEVEDGWWRGILRGKKGVFPSNFVTMVDESASTLKANDNNNGAYALANNNVTSADQAPELPPKPVREYARVVFPYATAQPDELELKEGDVITILSKDCEDKGWWKGELNNKIGVFPDNFVELMPVSNMGTMKPERPPTGSSATAATRSSLTTSLSETDSRLSISGSTSTSARTPKSPIDQLASVAAFIAAQQQHTATTSLSDEQKLIEKMQVADEIDYNHVITPTEALSHPTALRVKPAKRRPPSAVFLKDFESNGGLPSPTGLGSNGLSAHHEEEEKPASDVKSEEPVEITKTKTAVVKPPWMEELKRNQEEAKKNQEKKMSVGEKPVAPPTTAKPILPKTVTRAPSVNSKPAVPGTNPPGSPTDSLVGKPSAPSQAIPLQTNPPVSSPVVSNKCSTTSPITASKLPATSPINAIRPTSMMGSPVLPSSKQMPSPIASTNHAIEEKKPLPSKFAKQPPGLPNSQPVGKPVIPPPSSASVNNVGIQEELVDLRKRVLHLESTVEILQQQLVQMKVMLEEERKLRLQRDASPLIHL